MPLELTEVRTFFNEVSREWVGVGGGYRATGPTEASALSALLYRIANHRPERCDLDLPIQRVAPVVQIKRKRLKKCRPRVLVSNCVPFSKSFQSSLSCDGYELPAIAAEALRKLALQEAAYD